LMHGMEDLTVLVSILEYHGTYVRPLATMVVSPLHLSACISSRFEIMLYLYMCTYSTIAMVCVHMYVHVYHWYHNGPYTCSHGTNGTTGTLVPWYGTSRYMCTYQCYHNQYHGTMVHIYVLRYSTHVRTRVRTYVLIMLCHNFLIGKGHTCALRTTCVLGGYTAAS